MDAATKERLSASQRRRWAERKAAQQRVAEQLAVLQGANQRWHEALPWALAALSMHRECDPVIAQALDRLEAASDAVKLSNVEARDLLAEFGVEDPTQPARPDVGGANGDREGRDATRGH